MRQTTAEFERTAEMITALAKARKHSIIIFIVVVIFMVATIYAAFYKRMAPFYADIVPTWSLRHR